MKKIEYKKTYSFNEVVDIMAMFQSAMIEKQQQELLKDQSASNASSDESTRQGERRT